MDIYRADINYPDYKDTTSVMPKIAFEYTKYDFNEVSHHVPVFFPFGRPFHHNVGREISNLFPSCVSLNMSSLAIEEHMLSIIAWYFAVDATGITHLAYPP